MRRPPVIAVLAVLLAAMSTFADELTDAPAPQPTPADGRFHPAYVQRGVPDGALATTTARAPESAAQPSARTVTPPPRRAVADADEEPEPLPSVAAPVPGLEPLLWQGDAAELPAAPPLTRTAAAYRRGGAEPDLPGMLMLSPAEGDEWVEGSPVTIRWLSCGPIRKVRIYYSYERCKFAERSRGEVGVVLADMIPDNNQFTWAKVPWLDTGSVRLRIAGYDAEGNRVAADEVGLHFRPRELVGLPDTCIAIVKRHQRLYYLREGKIVRMHIVSTAASGYWTPTMKPGSYDRRRGAMGKVFSKSTSAWSRMYNCTMPYWMAITSSGSHGIHATSPPFYHRLGSPASHGCVRQHRTDARILFGMVPVGTKVYVF